MKEALKLALEALEYRGGSTWLKRGIAVEAIKEALAQDEQSSSQEPVAWEQFYPDIGKPQLRQEPSITKEARGTLILHSGWDDLPNGTKFYTTPPKRPWVGLTDEDIALIDWESLATKKDCARAIEAKLKEKNT